MSLAPTHWRIPVKKPLKAGAFGRPLTDEVPCIALTFVARVPFQYYPLPEGEGRLVQYQCQDCQYATLNEDEIVCTRWDHDPGTGFPSEDQQTEMQDHARQHALMWAWVESIK